MMIDGMNQELQIKLLKALDINIIDEYELYIGFSENKFDWLSPIEELTSGFISNLSFQGSTIGNLVSNEIRRLPQRNKWIFYKLGINLKKDFVLSKNIHFFYDFDYRLIETDGYEALNSTPKSNMSIKSGLKFSLLDNFTLSISASLFKNNLFGYEILRAQKKKYINLNTNSYQKKLIAISHFNKKKQIFKINEDKRKYLIEIEPEKF